MSEPIDDEWGLGTQGDPHEPHPSRNYYIDPETEVRKVYRGWVENGQNLTYHGQHANLLAGIRDDYDCMYYVNDHSECQTSDQHVAYASLYSSDKVGFPTTVHPKYLSREKEMLDRSRSQPTRMREVREGLVVRNLMQNGLISSEEYDAMMAQLQRDHENMRRGTTGPRYQTRPIRVGRPAQGGVPYEPDFRVNPEALASTLESSDWTPPQVFNFDLPEQEEP